MLIKRLESRYALVLPTATRVRKIGSTTVALNVGEGAEASMITHQLSQIDKLHYQAFVGDMNSAKAFQSMEAFRKKKMTRSFFFSKSIKRVPYTDDKLASILRILRCLL